MFVYKEIKKLHISVPSGETQVNFRENLEIQGKQIAKIDVCFSEQVNGNIADSNLNKLELTLQNTDLREIASNVPLSVFWGGSPYEPRTQQQPHLHNFHINLQGCNVRGKTGNVGGTLTFIFYIV